MGKRIYNILFHLHTVTGIVISVVLFVIFFAGSFSFFRDEIVNWERNHNVAQPNEINLSFDQAIDSLKNSYDLYGRELSFAHAYNEQRVNVNLSASADTLADEDAKKAAFFYLDTESFDNHTYNDSYTLGEFLYRLHFLAQIPYPAGYYLSGFTAFFFLIALITGLIIHWDKIIKNFYLFRPWEKLKTVWTDAHTTLGLIGFPFQLVYAITGAFFMLNLLLVAPSVFVLYDGDGDQLYDDLGYKHPTFPMGFERIESEVSVDQFIAETKFRWNGVHISHVIVHNYGDKNMHVTVEGRAIPSEKFLGVGEVTYKATNGEVVNLKDGINESTYLESTKLALYQLHYADYGGVFVRVVSFVLGLISCFVIISGVLIWLTARNKKNIREKRRKFNQWVGWVYMSVCLSMYPVTALTFIMVKVFNSAGQQFIYTFYFIGWLVLSVFFMLKKDNFITTTYTLLYGGIIGLFVPLANGIFSGQWLWNSLTQGKTDIFLVDLLWLVLGTLTIYASFQTKRNSTAY